MVKALEKQVELDQLEKSLDPDAGFWTSPYIRAAKLKSAKILLGFGYGKGRYRPLPNDRSGDDLEPGRVEPGTGPVIVNNHNGDNYYPLVAPDDVGGSRTDETDRIQ